MQPLLSSSKAVARLLQRSSRSLAVNLRNGKGSLGTSSGWKDGRVLDRFAPTRRFFSSTPRIGNPWIDDLVDGAKNSNHLIGNSHGSTQTRSFLGCSDGEEGNVLSKVYEERRVLGYSPEQMFSVVAAVDMYEDFVPWCQRSKIIKRNSDGSFDAELEIGFKFLVESYVSHVEMQRPKYIKTTALSTGLFDHLINIWEFNPGPVPGTCDLYFLVDFKFQSPLYRQVASMFFKEVVSRLVVSFTGRCQRIYGPAVQVLETSYGQSR